MDYRSGIENQNMPMDNFAPENAQMMSPMSQGYASPQTYTPASDLRPLAVDFPRIMDDMSSNGMDAGQRTIAGIPPSSGIYPMQQELHTDPLPTEVMPQSGQLHNSGVFSPGLQSYSAPDFPSPQSDPFLEAIMRQAQMGIFALPDKEGDDQSPVKDFTAN